jgi:hypothetical protein
MVNKETKTGGFVAGAGCLFAIAPMAASIAALAFGSDIGNVLSWFTYFTAPIGAVAIIVGIILAIVGASTSKPEDLVKAEASGAEPATAVSLPPLSRGLARSVKLAYAIGFVVVLVSCVMRATLFQPGFSILTIFDLAPAFFAGWLVWLARGSSEGLHFLRLVQSQLIVSIAGCVFGLWPLLNLGANIEMLDFDGIDRFQWAGTIITDLIPFAASVSSLVFASIARSRYRESIAKS